MGTRRFIWFCFLALLPAILSGLEALLYSLGIQNTEGILFMLACFALLFCSFGCGYWLCHIYGRSALHQLGVFIASTMAILAINIALMFVGCGVVMQSK